MPRTNRAPLWSVTAFAARQEEDAIAEFLRDTFGSSVASYCDMETGRTVITVYLKDRKTWLDKVSELKERWSRSMTGDFPVVRLGRIRQQDWAQSWKRHFKPLRIGRSVCIRPSWSRVRLAPGEVEVVLDPGLSFGTGQHPTTEFCLRETVRRRQEGVSQGFLDIGTGSGILAITAAKLGYSPVEAFDMDPESIRIATGNARKNKVSRKIKFAVRDVTKRAGESSGLYPVVCANLISTIIVGNCESMLKRVEPGGVFIAAGILAVEFDQVRKALARKGWKMVRSKKEKEWRSGTFRRAEE